MHNTIKELKTKYDYTPIAFCKETLDIWKELELDYTKCRCNCMW